MSDLLLVLVALAFLIAVAVLSWIGLRFLARETTKKGKWGINRTAVHCPSCGSRMPKFRIPLTFRQGVWGGWTCSHCGCEMDKWGRKTDSHPESA